ncbi:uncharacterized protein LOC123311731 [Coccinella septempunctata]|uniref:uncharacterized protein LOC123311731 n=1 Tax=Coccinella septempunctata TaxID=41139 RepID=UPI001D093DD8|nr:uncharacterized protein LOC123311731 [Coccinella septempunctata]
MPCLKEKIISSPLSVDEMEVLNYFIQALPDSAIAKHRKGRNSNIIPVDSGKNCSTSEILDNILVNCAQSVVMMELASVNNANSLDCCSKILENFSNDNLYEAIELQQNSSSWHNLRKYRITGSRCYEIYTYGGGDWSNKSTKYFWPKSLTNKYVRHGLKFEENAISAFKLKTNLNVQRCGIIIPHNNPWLAYSPDGIIVDHNQKPTALLEVKCLYDGASSSIEDILNQCKFISREEGQYALKKRHKYYGQIQMGMAVLNLEKCFFVLYASYDDSMKIIEVSYDYVFVKEMLEKIKFNFINKMVHVICENNIE